jgi:hypothetical protein
LPIPADEREWGVGKCDERVMSMVFSFLPISHTNIILSMVYLLILLQEVRLAQN